MDTHLIIVLRLDSLIDITAALEHTQTISPQDLEHGLFVWVMTAVANKCSFLDASGIRR